MTRFGPFVSLLCSVDFLLLMFRFSRFDMFLLCSVNGVWSLRRLSCLSSFRLFILFSCDVFGLFRALRPSSSFSFFARLTPFGRFSSFKLFDVFSGFRKVVPMNPFYLFKCLSRLYQFHFSLSFNSVEFD